MKPRDVPRMVRPFGQFGGFESHPAVRSLVGPVPHRVPRWTTEDEANLARRVRRCGEPAPTPEPAP